MRLWLVFVCACASAGPPAVTAPPTDKGSLGAGDVFEVRVYQEPDLSGAYRLGSDGTIDFPLLGRVELAGKTASETAAALTQRLKSGYLKNPQVTVMVKEYNSKKVFVLGQVARPGAYAFSEDMSIVNAIAQAGGFTRSALPNSTHVTRQDQRIPVHVDEIGKGAERNFALAPGDIVFVPESIF